MVFLLGIILINKFVSYKGTSISTSMNWIVDFQVSRVLHSKKKCVQVWKDSQKLMYSKVCM